MIKENKQELYTSPKVKVVEIKVRQVLCQSNRTQTSQEGSTDGWY